MAGKLDYRIIKNKPTYGDNGQYYFDTITEQWHYATGLESIAIGDDLYTTQIDHIMFSTENFSSYENAPGGIITNFFDPQIGLELGDETPLTRQTDYRFISNVYVGDKVEGSYLQKYHELASYEYILSSAPNMVTLYFDIALHNHAFTPELLTPLLNCLLVNAFIFLI